MHFIRMSVFIFVWLMSFSARNGEIFSSVAHIERSITASRKLTEEIREIAWKSSHKNYQLPDEVRDVYVNLKHMEYLRFKEPGFITDHPIKIFRLMNNIYNFFNGTFNNVFNQSYAEDLVEEIPKFDDVIGTVDGLLRLQTTYDLDTRLVSQGFIAGQKSFNLTADECYTIGKIAIEEGYNQLGTQWLRAAWERVPESARKDRLYIIKILTNHTFSIGSYEEAMQYAREWAMTSPEDSEAQRRYSQYDEHYSKAQAAENQKVLCQDTDWVNPEWRKLKCYLKQQDHPLLILQPVRVEEMKRDPYIVLYHNFLSELEIQQLKAMSEEETSGLNNYTRHEKGVYLDRRIRISKGKVLSKAEAANQHIRRRIAAITALETQRGGEKIQVLKYGVAGHYNYHTDYWAQLDTAGDNRVATFMMYLSNVKAGGATVFPLANVRVAATKGTAVFWYNMHRSCAPDVRTLHFACPVMLGSKWVATLWIHRYWNEFYRPCSLFEDE